jgi:transcriptional regulator with XRE-family HTH domain
MATRRQRFAARRKAVGFSQEQLAERLGVERSTVVRWESGETLPQPWLQPKIARALQVSTEQLDELLLSGTADELEVVTAEVVAVTDARSVCHVPAADMKNLPDLIRWSCYGKG